MKCVKAKVGTQVFWLKSYSSLLVLYTKNVYIFLKWQRKKEYSRNILKNFVSEKKGKWTSYIILFMELFILCSLLNYFENLPTRSTVYFLWKMNDSKSFIYYFYCEDSMFLDLLINFWEFMEAYLFWSSDALKKKWKGERKGIHISFRKIKSKPGL